MGTCSCDFQYSFYSFLTFDIRKIQLMCILLLIEFLSSINNHWLIFPGSIQKGNDISKIFHTIDIKIIDHSCLTYVIYRNNKSVEFFLSCLDCYWQDCPNRL